MDEPELVKKFVMLRDTGTYRGFQTTASGMAAEAQSRKDLLLKHRLAEEVLTGVEVAPRYPAHLRRRVGR